MGGNCLLRKEKHGQNIRNGFQKCLKKRKTWSEYKEWPPKMSPNKTNMAQIMREKPVSYIRYLRVYAFNSFIISV